MSMKMEMEKVLLLAVTCLLHEVAVGDVSITTTGQATNSRWLRSTGIFVDGPNHLVYEVKASRDALLSLSTSDSDDSQRWHVVLGGHSNTRNFMRSLACQTQTQTTCNRKSLDPNSYRTFWISWNQTHIRLGTGSVVGVNGYCSHEGPASPTDLYVRLGSYGSLNTVNWIIHTRSSTQTTTEMTPSTEMTSSAEVVRCQNITKASPTEDGTIGLCLGLGIGGGVVVVLLIELVVFCTCRRKGHSHRNAKESTYTDLVLGKDFNKKDKPQTETSKQDRDSTNYDDRSSSVYDEIGDPSAYMEPANRNTQDNRPSIDAGYLQIR